MAAIIQIFKTGITDIQITDIQHFRKLLLLAYLAVCAYEDIKTRSIGLGCSLLFAAAGIALVLAQCLALHLPATAFAGEALTGMLVFLLFSAVSLITKGAVGAGDGLCLLVSSLFTERHGAAALVFTSLFLCMAAAVPAFFITLAVKREGSGRKAGKICPGDVSGKAGRPGTAGLPFTAFVFAAALLLEGFKFTG